MPQGWTVAKLGFWESGSQRLLKLTHAAGLDSGDRPMQLRDLAAALRKSEDVNDKLRALKSLEGALLAAPDELKHYAGWFWTSVGL